jgi:hypothetical protein
MRTEVIIPTCSSTGEKLPPQLVRYWTTQTVERLNKTLGGSTRYNGVGSWIDDRGTTHEERVIVVWSWGAPNAEQYSALVAHCEAMAVAVGQLSVSIAVNGSPEFIVGVTQ